MSNPSVPPGTPPMWPPSCYDRADGSSVINGTATPEGTLLTDSSLYMFEEYPDSPSIERAEQATIVHRFKVDPTTGMFLIGAYGRGMLQQDSYGKVTQILSSSFNYERGGFCTFQTTSESLSFDIPPDEFESEAVDLAPAIERHPRYAYFNAGDFKTIRNLAEQSDLYLKDQATLETFLGARSGKTVPGMPNTTYLALAKELYLKMARGQNSFYLAGFHIRQSRFSYRPPFQNPGGYIDDPFPSINPYFWSEDGMPDGDNIFTKHAAYISPVLYQFGLSWLRQADVINWGRTWFRTTSSWIGAPAGGTIPGGGTWMGIWDDDIYRRTWSPPPALSANPTPGEFFNDMTNQD